LIASNSGASNGRELRLSNGFEFDIEAVVLAGGDETESWPIVRPA